jgi:hemolysin III
MTRSTTTNQYSPAEEIANSTTHAVGIVLAVAGLGVLTGFAGKHGDAWHIASTSIFGATMILTYTASTLYHSVRAPRGKALLRIFDHCAIFLLIAGTYTPFTLVTLRGPWGWSLFGTVWGLALFGIIYELTPLRRYRMLSHALYVGMGWAIIVAIKPMLSSIAPGGLVLMVAGGLAYTLGVGFYALRKMRYHHAVWHLFVLAGTTLHFFAVLLYVIPVAGS